ncbi:MAG: fasciclin domain-containing protein, partial [Gluconacetobacter diazotrophicus]|nr:fasciclin domain-containing protein [Gluconacetobacter diazotrophicus]
QARQDPLFVRNSTDSAVALDTGLFRDRPLDESIRSSLTLADYSRSLDSTGLLALLQRPGPYTVFAVPNQPMEAEQLRAGNTLLKPVSAPLLRRLMAYTIVPGRYTTADLRAAIAKRGGPIGLRTVDGATLTVSQDPRSGQLLLSDPAGNVNRIWFADMPQSNGVLYATQSLLDPAAPPRTLR